MQCHISTASRISFLESNPIEQSLFQGEGASSESAACSSGGQNVGKEGFFSEGSEPTVEAGSSGGGAETLIRSEFPEDIESAVTRDSAMRWATQHWTSGRRRT